jgi:lambda family phage portal protein
MGLFSRKQDLFSACFGPVASRSRQAPATEIVQSIPVSALGPAPVRTGYHDGEKFAGGFGITSLLWTDYWTLRARSAELFQRNLYARGLIRRMVTNEINVGLHLEATPETALLGLERGALDEWSETVENRFNLWAHNPKLCDHAEQNTFGELQAITRLESLVVGDLLVVPRQDPRTKLPRLQLINGSKVQTPLSALLGKLPNGNRIVHGVEIDGNGRHVAYHVRQDDPSGMGFTSKRLPAWGEKSGRRLAWLVYGTDKRMDEVRGQPLLSLVMQSLKEIDRYRDSVQLKATINAMLALVVEKTAAGPGARPLAAAGITRRLETAVDNEGTARKFTVADWTPGVTVDELNAGETIKGFQSHGTDEKFGDFEKSIIHAVAWGNGIPPEILMLSFDSNYSASQAAINEYKLYLNPVRTWFGSSFCAPIYQEWLLSEVLDRRIDAPRLLESWRDGKLYDVHAAWTSCDWAGNIKPAVDLSKLVGGYVIMIEQGIMTRGRAAREINGSKYSKNIEQLLLENKQLAEANKPLAELEAAAKAPVQGESGPGKPGRPRTRGNNDEDPEDINREDDDNEEARLHVVARA